MLAFFDMKTLCVEKHVRNSFYPGFFFGLIKSILKVFYFMDGVSQSHFCCVVSLTFCSFS
jgi:hypothetical protein